MVVKFKLKVIFSFLFVFEQLKAAKCNKKFLEAHMLSGLDESVPVPLTICPFVKDRCCSIADEIKIVKFYKEGTAVLLESHQSSFYSLLTRLFGLMDEFKLIDPMQMNIRYKVRKHMKYNQEVCYREV